MFEHNPDYIKEKWLPNTQLFPHTTDAATLAAAIKSHLDGAANRWKDLTSPGYDDNAKGPSREI